MTVTDVQRRSGNGGPRTILVTNALGTSRTGGGRTILVTNALGTSRSGGGPTKSATSVNGISSSGSTNAAIIAHTEIIGTAIGRSAGSTRKSTVEGVRWPVTRLDGLRNGGKKRRTFYFFIFFITTLRPSCLFSALLLRNTFFHILTLPHANALNLLPQLAL
jgi:hypothetical protein